MIVSSGQDSVNTAPLRGMRCGFWQMDSSELSPFELCECLQDSDVEGTLAHICLVVFVGGSCVLVRQLENTGSYFGQTDSWRINRPLGAITHVEGFPIPFLGNTLAR